MDIANKMDQKTQGLWFREIIRTGLSPLQDRDGTFNGVNNIVHRGESDDLAIILCS
jgi:hypothetical protein